jgi:hypothetical protein
MKVQSKIWLGKGRCTECQKNVYLWQVTYLQRHTPVTRKNWCETCLTNENWTQVQKDTHSGYAFFGWGNDLLNAAELTVHHATEPVLQCQFCRGYQNELIDAVFHRDIHYNPTDFLPKIQYLKSVKMLRSVCTACLCRGVWSTVRIHSGHNLRRLLYSKTSIPVPLS